MFQLTAARRRLAISSVTLKIGRLVSTHSRPKAAGLAQYAAHECEDVSTHSRPKAAGTVRTLPYAHMAVSTHSRPKAAGASAETLNRQGLHCPVSLRFH